MYIVYLWLAPQLQFTRYDIKQTSNSPKKPKMTDKTGDVTSDNYVN